MIGISAQISLYPLRQEAISPAIDKALAIFRKHGLDIKPSPMSTLISGDDEMVFAAIQEAFRMTASDGEIVMVATFSNACPVSANFPEEASVPVRNERNEVMVHPIGIVQNTFDDSSQWQQMRTSESHIVLNPNLVEGIQGLKQGQQVMVVFHFNRSENYELLQHPRGDCSQPRRGVFSLRSPRRPNPIGVTVVKILSIDQNVLTVRGLDAFNGTPVLDLKPT
jgi:tRNA-Thr(GGU) m(6)t(6)A37 methyltransferase TsaA